jgi:hypothetical protein
MNNEVKEILIDLIDYYNAIGTEDDPGIRVFEKVAQRASKALDRFAAKQSNQQPQNSGDVDPYGMDVVATIPYQMQLKLEDEW